MLIKAVKPIHKHDCEACIFLGKNTEESFDYYICPNWGDLIVRFDSEGPNYSQVSILHYNHFIAHRPKEGFNMYRECAELALEAGLIDMDSDSKITILRAA